LNSCHHRWLMVFNRFERFTVLSSLRLCRRLCDYQNVGGRTVERFSALAVSL
jgi:hypothetical protein